MKKRALLGLVSLLAVIGVYFAWAPASQGKTPTPRRETVVKRPVRPRLPTSLAAAPAADDTPAPTADPAAPALVFSAKWGGATDELGRERPAEGDPVGPMSFGLDAKGRSWVLDGVNGRMVRRGADGKVDKTVRLDMMNPEDIAVAPDGSSAVLDRFSDKSVTLYDESGNLRGKLPLAGEGVPDVGSVTGVFVDGKDVYVERDHGTLVNIGTSDGVPADPRNEIPGRPSRDGQSYLSAGIIEAAAGRVYVASVARATGTQRFTRELGLEAYVQSIVLLDSDKSGTIYFASQVETAPGQDSILLTCLDRDSGTPVGSAVLPANTMPEESFRDLAVLDGGGVVLALRSEAGVSYTRYDCR